MDEELLAAVREDSVPLDASAEPPPHGHDVEVDDDADECVNAAVDVRASSSAGGGGASSVVVSVSAPSPSTAASSAAGGGGSGGGMLLPSFIWDFFVKEAGGKFVVCTLCPSNQRARFAYSGGTSTMNRHLRKKHHKFAPGKCAADYEFAKATAAAATGGDSGVTHKRHSHATNTVDTDRAAAAAVGVGVAASGSLSPDGGSRRQLLELRGSRRRASTKRRKVLHPALLDAEPAGGAQDFDPVGFAGLQGHAASPSPGAGLHFPPGFELSDDLGGDQRFFDYNSLTSAGPLGLVGLGRGGRRSAASSANQKVLTHRLLKYLIAQYEPLDVSRMGTELSVLLYGTDYPSAKVPAEETLKLALANLYYSQREILKEVVAEVEVLSLSLNNWKSVFGQNVLTVSGHWISNGFSRRDCVLEVYVLPLDESVNTLALLRDVMDKWDIPAGKVAALTMIKNGKEEAIHDEYPGLAVVDCFVHVLDSAVAAGLLKCAPLLRRCRNYVSYFIQNPSEYQIFLSLQRKVAEANAGLGASDTSDAGGVDDDADGKAAGGGASSSSPKLSGVGAVGGGAGAASGSASSSAPMLAPALPVICDFEHRWNSTSEMICRIVELEHLLLLYKSGLESDTNPNRRPMQLRFVCCELSSDEWANLKELARLLEPIEGVAHVTHVEYPGLSIIHPLLHSIKKHLDDAELWVSTPLVAAVRNAIASGLAMQLCVSGAAPTSPYLSSLLDPRFKSLAFVHPDERERVVELLQMLHGELIGDKDAAHHQHPLEKKKSALPTPAPAPLAAAVKKTAGLLHEFFPLDEPTTELEKLTAQVQQYLESPSLPATDESENDPLEWWSRYQRMFPFLAKLAKKFLCISAVSLPLYEAFTNYGQLMKEKKARLDIEVAAQILFCRSVSRIPEMDRMNV